MEATLEHLDLKKNLLPFKRCADLLRVNDDYSLPNRYTSKSIVESFGNSLKEAQITYEQNISAAFEIVNKNISSAIKMDSVFGCSEDAVVDSAPVQIAKDGRYKLNCPFETCKSCTVKLKRHLISKHGLSSEDASYGTMMSLKMTVNRMKTSSAVRSKPKRPQTHQNAATVLVAGRHNYRKCPVCRNLYKNLGQHLQEFHEQKKGSVIYEDFLENAELVPKCYTKMENGKAVLLKGGELESAREIYQAEIEKQTGNLQVLKSSRKKIELLRDEIRNEEQDSLCIARKKAELVQVTEKYNQIKYQKCEESPKLKSWKAGYLKFLIMMENSDPPRAVSMALSILQPHETKKVSLQ